MIAVIFSGCPKFRSFYGMLEEILKKLIFQANSYVPDCRHVLEAFLFS